MIKTSRFNRSAKPALPKYIFGRQAVANVLNYHRNLAQKLLIRDQTRWIAYANSYQLPYQIYTPLQFNNQFSGWNHQFIALEVTTFPLQNWAAFQARFTIQPNTSQLFLVLDHLQDSYNFGAIIRTAAACQVNGIIIPKARQVLPNSAVAKAAAGTLYHVPIIQVANLAHAVTFFQKQQFWVWATSLQRAPSQVARRLLLQANLVLIVGNEARGISSQLQKLADYNLRLPMAQPVESLNVSVATGICLYELRRLQRFDNN